MKTKSGLVAIALLVVGLTYWAVQSPNSISSLLVPQAVSQGVGNLRAGDPLPENIFVELAKVVNPAIVNIAIEAPNQQMARPRDPMWDLFEQFMGPGFQLPPQQQQRRGPMSVGTGFVIESNGLAITNNHVVDNGGVIKATFANQPTKKYDVEVVGRDPRTDFALIRIKGAGSLPTVKLGDSRSVQVGQWVAAFGNPYGHSFSMSKGIVSAIGRSIRELNAVPFIQTDASINPGNSGGPLVNLKGEVIGVNSAIDARAQGIGFAIPIDDVKALIPQLKEKGRVIRGYIGTVIDDINPRARQALNLTVDQGALIMDVMEESPAAKGGLQPYDVVTKFGDKKVETAQDLQDAVAETKIGESRKLEIIREGKARTLTVTVAEPPEQRQVRSQQRERGEVNTGDLGFRVENFSPQLARELGLPANIPKRPVVTMVARGSPAEASGLRAGDVILDVNQKRVATVADVQRNLRQGSNVLRVQNGNQVSLVFIR